jgi:hypothetical protein
MASASARDHTKQESRDRNPSTIATMWKPVVPSIDGFDHLSKP